MSPVVLTEVERAGDKAAYQNTTASESWCCRSDTYIYEEWEKGLIQTFLAKCNNIIF